MTDQVLTVKEVANFLKVSKWKVYRMAAAERITVFKVRSSECFKREVVHQRSVSQDNQPDICSNNEVN